MGKRGSADSWIDDAFDDEKMQAEIDSARRSRNTGCLIGLVAFVIVMIAVVLIGISMLTTL